MCGFTLSVVQVTERGVDVIVTCGFTLYDSGRSVSSVRLAC